MTDSKAHIKVFVTKTNRFRVRVTEEWKGGIPSNTQRVQVYEVSIGGEAWSMGKGGEHIASIKVKVERLLRSLIADYVACVLNLNRHELGGVQKIEFGLKEEFIRLDGKNVD